MKQWIYHLFNEARRDTTKIVSMLILTIVTATLAWWGTRTLLIPLTIGGVGVLLAAVHVFHMQRHRIVLIQQRQTAFISFLGILFVFLENRFNVFQAVKESRQYVDHQLVPLLDDLLDQLEVDPSVEPYLVMANHFQSQTITQIMLLLHQLSEQGYEREIVARYQEMLMHIHMDTVSAYVDSVNHRFNWYYSFPLVGTVILTTFFALGVLEQVVESLYG